MTTAPAHCPTCSAPLRADGVCLACAFREGLASAGGGTTSDVVARPASDSTPFAALSPKMPERIGVYALRREVARGGMGVVYEAEDTKLHRTVALKMVRGFAFAGRDDMARFRAETEATAVLDHPNIVPIYEVGEYEGQPYFTMKLIAGESLAARLKSGPMPARAAAALMIKVARAVQHAHSRGVLHRDLKPANILLDAAGEPWLTDFGLAKFADVDSGITVSTSHLGTPQYMSPEQAAGRTRSISTVSDVWSLGVMLYQMLSGRLPFEGENSAEVMRRIVEEEAAPLARKVISNQSSVISNQASAAGELQRAGDCSLITDNSSFGPDLSTIVKRCLEKEPSRRLRSAAFLADELERWRAGKPIQSRHVTPAEQAFKWIRRRPKIAALLAALFLSLFTGLIGITAQWRQAELARQASDTHAASARNSEQRARDAAYFATLAQALAARQQGDLGHSRLLLEKLDPARRDFEWRLLRWLCRGDELQRTEFNGAEPRCVAWEPSRKRIAVLTGDRVLRWVDPVTGAVTTGATVPDPRARHAPIALDHGFHALAFSPDGRHFLCADGDVLIIAETDSGRLLHSCVGRRMGGVWLDKGRVLFAGNVLWGAWRGDPTGIFDVARGTADILPGKIHGPLALSPDRQLLAWARHVTNDVFIEVFSAADVAEAASSRASPKHTLALSGSWPSLVTFSADQQQLAVAHGRQAGSLRDLTIFSVPEGKPVFTHELPVQIHALAFSPDEPVLAVAAADATVRTFRWQHAAPETLSYDDDSFPALAQPAGTSGPQLSPASLLTRSTGAGRFGFLLGHQEGVRDLAFLPGAASLVTVSGDGAMHRWPLESSAQRSRVGGVLTANAWEHPVASADGRRVLYRAETNQTWLWDRPTGRRLAYPPQHYPLAALSDGRTVTRQSEAGEIFVWAPPDRAGQSPRELWRVQGIRSHPGFGQAVCGALSRDERILAGLIPGKLLVVDLGQRTADGTGDQRMLYGISGVNSMDLSPDGRLIAVTGFLGRHTRLYQTTNVNGGFVSLGDAEDYDTAVAFHPDGRRLFAGNEDGRVRVFHLPTGKELTKESWRAQSGGVTALAVSADGRMIATSGDHTLQFWDALPAPGEPRRERLRMNVPAPRNWMRFGNGDTVFLHVAPGHALEAWEAP